jgi:hypothetical protein
MPLALRHRRPNGWGRLCPCARPLARGERGRPCRPQGAAHDHHQQRHPRFTEGKDVIIAALNQQHIPVRWYAFANAPHDFWLFEPWLPTLVDQIDGFLASLPDQEHGPRPRPDQGK